MHRQRRWLKETGPDTEPMIAGDHKMTNGANLLRNLSASERRALIDKLKERRSSAGRVAPLSYAQQRLWFLDQLVIGNPYYNETSALRLLFPIEARALRQALNYIVRRHESLRTVFEPTADEPQQRILEHLEFELPVQDLSDLPVDRRESAAVRLAQEQSRIPFNLTKGPLIRVRLIRFSADDFVFVLTMHHVVCDGWSMQILFDELYEFYEAEVTGTPVNMPPLPVQYADFSVWQRQQLTGATLDRQLDFWRDQLAGLTALELLTDFPRPPVPSFTGARKRISIHEDVYRRLMGVCEEEKATLFMGLLALYQILLKRYTGQDDVVVGSPVANRNRPELERLIGFFVNTLIMRTDLAGNPSFRRSLRRVRDMAVSAFAHQDVPFERLVEELRPERDPSRNPVFQVTFQIVRAPASLGKHLSENLLRAVDVETRTAKFDLSCDLWESARGVEGYLEFSSDLFRDETIDAMARHFETLVRNAALTPDARIGELSLLSEEEERQLLDDSHGPEVAAQGFGCVHQLFERRVAQQGEALAVCDANSAISYVELNRRSNQLARYLKSRGVVPGSLVAVLMDRSVEYVVVIISIMKAGAVYVPLDPAYPADRLVLMIKAGTIQLVLTKSEHAQKVPGGVAVVCLDADQELGEKDDFSDLPCQVDGRSLAYVIFTSGSTGRPKGVEVLHSSLSNLVQWHNSQYEVNQYDRATLYASPAFDASVWEMWPYLTAGASLWIPDKRVHASPEELVGWIADKEITISFLPTPIAESVIELDLPPGLRLRALLTGGDKLQWYPRRALPFRLVNHYGPTENTVVATAVDVTAGPEDEVPPIGKPIDNVGAYVLDRYLRPVPVGVKGELYLGGRGLARGYLNDNSLTDERFVPNPFDRRRGARMYRTGDRVRYRHDGQLEFHGRVDRQVKLRGFRIEPGDIENALGQHPSVGKCLVVPTEAPDGGVQIVAYVVPDRDEAVNGSGATSEVQQLAQQLREHLRARLPDYMVPAQFVWMERLPVTPNGKLNRQALPAPYPQDLISTYIAPRGKLEEQIATIWSEILGIDHISVQTNFFDLGGHSLLLVRVHSRLKQTVQTDLSIVDLFLYPTVRALAHAISVENGQSEPAATSVPWHQSYPRHLAPSSLAGAGGRQ